MCTNSDCNFSSWNGSRCSELQFSSSVWTSTISCRSRASNWQSWEGWFTIGCSNYLQFPPFAKRKQRSEQFYFLSKLPPKRIVENFHIRHWLTLIYWRNISCMLWFVCWIVQMQSLFCVRYWFFFKIMNVCIAQVTVIILLIMIGMLMN